jgi:hypothetical protein
MSYPADGFDTSKRHILIELKFNAKVTYPAHELIVPITHVQDIVV